MNVVDSSGWIEYFIDTASAENFAPAIEKTALLIVPALSFFEVHRYLSRNADAERRDACLDIMRRGTVIELTAARAIAASDIAQKHRLAMADAIMYSIAREFNATFWTQDVDYKDLPGVAFHAKSPAF
jgi:predicted nucleic acid-binding protein